MNSQQRRLTFTSLDQIMPEVDRLLSAEYTLAGQWSVGQICKHLTNAITFSVEGYPALAPWIVRKTIGPVLMQRILKKGVFPQGIGLPAKFAPKPGCDARAEAEALRAALRHYQGHTGAMGEHPLSGKLTRAQWDAFHIIHSAHHLGFVVPAR